MKEFAKQHGTIILILGLIAVMFVMVAFHTNPSPLTVSQAQGAAFFGCTTSQVDVWKSYSLAPQTGTFTATIDATPNASATDALVGLSTVSPAAYTDLAVAVRFGSAKKTIDARNGGTYSAVQTIPYTAGKTYHFRIVVNVPHHTYSAYVTPAGGTEQVIGTNYAFRTEQADATSLNYWTPFSDVNTFQTCNWAVAPLDIQAPSIPQNVEATSISSSQIKVSWNASTDNVAVVGYDIYQDGQLKVSTGNINTSYIFSGFVPPTTHTYTVSAYDAAGNVSAQSAGATASITLSAYDQAVLGDHPVAFWDVDPQTVTQSSTEIDLSGHGNMGTYKNGLPTTATMPNGEKAADFNGSSQYLTIPSNPSFSVPTTGDLTWEAWIRPSTLQFPHGSDSDYVDFMGKCADYSPSCEWEGRMYDSTTEQTGRSSRISAYVFNPTAGLGSAADWQPTSDLLKADQWIYVVGEYTTKSQPSDCSATSTYPGSINIWVDGVEWSQSQHNPTGCMSQYEVVPKTGNSPFNIGSMALDTWFEGAVGKVAVYNYLLSQSQIDDHYRSMTDLTPTGSCGATCTL